MTHHSSPWSFLLLELGVGSIVGHSLTAIPAWLGGGLSALVVGVVLRLLDPTLKRIGERFAARRDALAASSRASLMATNDKDSQTP